MFTTLLTGGQVLDGTGTGTRRADAVITDKVITVVGTANSDVPIDSTVDLGGRTLIPGLIDCHASMGANRPEERADGVTQQAIGYSVARALLNGTRSLRGGVTTVRIDTVAHHALFALREIYASGWLDGPRLLVPGRAITVTGGHAWRSAHEADGPDGFRRAVREEIRAGADWIKLMPTGGAGTANEQVDEWQMAPEEIAAAVDAAHRRGRGVFAHVSAAAAAVACVEAGVDSIEHGFLLDRHSLEVMKAAGTFYVPTLSAYHHLVEASRAVPRTADPYDRGLQDVALEVYDRHQTSFRTALDVGVRIAAGTDSGADWFPMGDSLQLELEIMVTLGMAPADALAAATQNAAVLLRLADRVGTVEVGKLADLVVTDGNPLDDISALREPWLVMKEGRIVHRAAA